MAVSSHDGASPHIPHPAQLERAAARVRRVDHVAIAILVAADVLLAWRPVSQGDAPLLVLAGVLLALSSTFHLTGLLAFFRWPGRRLLRLGLTDSVGRYSSGQVRRLVHDVLAPHRTREMPEIYVTDSRHDNAFAINSLFFNFLRPLNAIYLSRHLFQILRPGEIRAVLTHELAHFHGYIRPLACTRFALTVFNALLPVLLWSEDILPSPQFVVVTWALFSAVLNLGLNRWLHLHARTFEFLADLEAARRCGILNVINGLFGCAKTSEVTCRVQARLLQAIRRNDTLSLDDLPTLFEQLDRTLPDTPLTADQVDQSVDRLLAARPVHPRRRKLSRAEAREQARRIDAALEALMVNREFHLVDWARFDTNPAEGRVDVTEYPNLVRILREEPDGQLFAVPHEHASVAARGTHPTIRERILFLERCRGEDPGLTLADPVHDAARSGETVEMR